jgi:hypothetical protein
MAGPAACLKFGTGGSGIFSRGAAMAGDELKL